MLYIFKLLCRQQVLLRLLQRLSDWARQHSKSVAKIILNPSILVPKPHAQSSRLYMQLPLHIYSQLSKRQRARRSQSLFIQKSRQEIPIASQYHSLATLSLHKSERIPNPQTA